MKVAPPLKVRLPKADERGSIDIEPPVALKVTVPSP